METQYSAGLVIIFDHKILLGHTTGRKWYGSYSIPKGMIESGETALDAAIRETKEELGISVPKNLIDKQEHTFTLTSRKGKYNKIVSYFIVQIDNLSQLGLKDLKIPKSQLQIKEIDWAGFLDYNEAIKRIMPSQLNVITNMSAQGLLESDVLKFNQYKHL
jgi:8-oxo-dGTP pyrophosphatase MutT (NUDIX family)